MWSASKDPERIRQHGVNVCVNFVGRLMEVPTVLDFDNVALLSSTFNLLSFSVINSFLKLCRPFQLLLEVELLFALPYQ